MDLEISSSFMNENGNGFITGKIHHLIPPELAIKLYRKRMISVGYYYYNQYGTRKRVSFKAQVTGFEHIIVPKKEIHCGLFDKPVPLDNPRIALQVAINEGFNTLQDFSFYFNCVVEDYKVYHIAHFTDFRYCIEKNK